ncbi:type I restriction-modification system subunit M [Sutcliffiella horikoshii]|uniref:type I restriction-modification system subunit M n=1 Tax=Sutcliffiella horikoshii TaxID=79883 RepID=UPI00384D6E8E
MTKYVLKTTNEAVQRAELHRKIWAIADNVRGAVDGWDFKQYILGILFYRFISENMTIYFNQAEHEAGDLEFDYAKLSDQEAEIDFRPNTVEDKGFFILPSQLFGNVVKNSRTNENLNIDLANIFRTIEASAIGFPSENDIKGLFEDLDTTSNRLGGTVAEKNKRLADIMCGIAEIDFGHFEENDIDAFGDAYEYLISNYASKAGKSGGEFFTPQSVSRLLARLVMDGKKSINKVYDPTCGSGSLLLQMKKQFQENIIEDGFFGQEINITNYNLARMNMFLHNINYNHFSIKRGDTLLNPMHHDEKPFDAIVSNPPYSIKWVGNDDPTLINDERFAPAGKLAPKSKADFAFIMHCLSYLSSKGRAAIVCFPGVFYRTGAEQTIRKYLVDNNFVDCVITLPENLFFGTSIATNILVLAKNKNSNRTLFIDATKEFKKGVNNNILMPQNIENIVAKFRDREDLEHFSKLVDNSEIAQNDYNLSVSSYVEKEEIVEKINIEELNREIKETIIKIDTLRVSIEEIVEGNFGSNKIK